MFDTVARLITLCTIPQRPVPLKYGEQDVPEVDDTLTASSVSSGKVSRDILTISDQHMGERPVFSAPPVDLYRPHECHYYHDKVEDHDTAPGHCQTLGRHTFTKSEG